MVTGISSPALGGGVINWQVRVFELPPKKIFLGFFFSIKIKEKMAAMQSKPHKKTLHYGKP